jgi:hypothetical protein
MSYLIIAPDMLAASAADVAGIGSSLSEANAGAAVPPLLASLSWSHSPSRQTHSTSRFSENSYHDSHHDGTRHRTPGG